MKAMIAGASGFIGIHLGETLLRGGHEFHCLARAKSRLPHLERAGAHVLRASFEDEAAMAEAVRGMDWIFHLAEVIHMTMGNGQKQSILVYVADLVDARIRCAENPAGPIPGFSSSWAWARVVRRT